MIDPSLLQRDGQYRDNSSVHLLRKCFQREVYQTLRGGASNHHVILFPMLKIAKNYHNINKKRVITMGNRSSFLLEDFKTILEHFPIGAYFADKDGNISFCNDAYANIYGYHNAEEIINTNIKQFWINLSDWENAYDLLSSKGRVIDYPAQHIKKNGEVIFVSISASLNPDGSRQGIVSDITEEVKSISERDSYESRLIQILNNLPQAVITFDQNCEILNISSGLSGLLSVNDPNKDKFSWFISHIKADFNKVLKDGIPIYKKEFHARYGISHEDVCLYYSIIKIEIQNQIQIILLINYSIGIPYITKLALDFIDEGILVTDLRGTILYANRAQTEIHGYGTTEELIGKDAIIFNPAEMLLRKNSSQQINITNFKRISKVKSIDNPNDSNIFIWKGEIENIRKDGKVVPILLSLFYIKNEKKINIGRIGIAQNLENIKNLEEKLKEERIIELLYAASLLRHKLLNRTTAIKHAIEIIKNPITNQNEIRDKWINLIESEVKLVENIYKEISRSVKAEKKKIDLNKILNKCISVLSSEYKNINIKIESDLNKDIFLYADPIEIDILFRNIIDNAFKAVIAKNIPQGKINIQLLKSNTQVIIKIEDNGIGIPKNEIDNIYKPYYDLKENSSFIKGAGLGLFQVKNIVARNKGTISVESTIGVGTIFYLYFPLQENINDN